MEEKSRKKAEMEKISRKRNAGMKEKSRKRKAAMEKKSKKGKVREREVRGNKGGAVK